MNLIRWLAQRFCGHDQRDLVRTVHNIRTGARRARIDAAKARRQGWMDLSKEQRARLDAIVRWSQTEAITRDDRDFLFGLIDVAYR